MFNSIKGIYRGKNASSIFVETFGIEWEILASSFTLDRFSEGDEVRVYTWLQHREDVMQLFGFAELKERLMFLDLIKVEGIGPKQAIKILSNITVESLEAALEDGDISRLQAISGIGKKTAQKMVLALKGKLSIQQSFQKPEEYGAKTSEYEEIVSALVDMGYERRRCLETVEKVAQKMKESGTEPLEHESDFFRLSIVELS